MFCMQFCETHGQNLNESRYWRLEHANNFSVLLFDVHKYYYFFLYCAHPLHKRLSGTWLAANRRRRYSGQARAPTPCRLTTVGYPVRRDVFWRSGRPAADRPAPGRPAAVRPTPSCPASGPYPDRRAPVRRPGVRHCRRPNFVPVQRGRWVRWPARVSGGRSISVTPKTGSRCTLRPDSVRR